MLQEVLRIYPPKLLDTISPKISPGANYKRVFVCAVKLWVASSSGRQPGETLELSESCCVVAPMWIIPTGYFFLLGYNLHNNDASMNAQ